MPDRRGWALGLAAVFLLPSTSRSGDPVDYLRDVKPLLTAHCVACHSTKKAGGDLRLDTAAGALAGGTLGPSVVPGQPDESELVLAVLGEGAGDRMPLNRPPLSEAEIDVLRRWVAEGASAPTDEAAGVAKLDHWAFRPTSDAVPPDVNDRSLPRNPIDRFILAPLERDGLTLSPEADRATLIRRATLDVTGLPPHSEEVDAFVSDPSPDAFDRLVDRLLASPAYGERWGRWWLDQARYADSNGYSIDAPREIWKYRDWVIDALNHDQPFDEFTVDQLAGDLRPGATLDQRVATGFHRNTQINQEGGTDPEQFRIDAVIDRVNTTGTVWLGLTVGCAQCHDHKYDPISQREYYQLFAFLNNCDEPNLPVASPEQVARQADLRRQIADYLLTIETDEELRSIQQKWETGLDMVGRQKQSQEVRVAFDLPFERRPIDRNRVVFAAFIEQSDDPKVKPHREFVTGLRSQEPTIPTTMIVQERAEPRDTRLLQGGDFTRPGDPVGPGVPAILPPLESTDGPKVDRLALARWLIDGRNPLTARVLANRLWQVYFGRGLVETDNDFGTQGTPPSHPELLDWLANRLVESGWSLKDLHRVILTSATYRQRSTVTPELVSSDPDNRRLARQSRLRLEAEQVRDASLAVSGLLASRIGGPSVYPPQPDGVMSLGQMRRDWKADTGPNRYRRGLYTFFWRATPHPMLVGFDAPDGNRACTRRTRSNTPLQALMLLNDSGAHELAEALADRLSSESTGDDRSRIVRAYRLCLSREPDEMELDRLERLVREERAGGTDREAWVALARVLMNLDEFLTRE